MFGLTSFTTKASYFLDGTSCVRTDKCTPEEFPLILHHSSLFLSKEISVSYNWRFWFCVLTRRWAKCSVCEDGVCARAASSGVSSCAGPGGPIGKRSGSTRRTGRAWLLCASGNDASVHPNGQSASHSFPTCTCRASHLEEGRAEEGLEGSILPPWSDLLMIIATKHTLDESSDGWRNWENWLF